MVISLTIFSSIFTYFEVIKSKVRNQINFIGAPLTFILVVCGLWEIINLLTFNLGLSYSLLYFFYLFSFIILIITFLVLGTSFIIKNKVKFVIFFHKSPVLIITLFLAIFFLFFYHEKFTWQSDMWFYYRMMNELHSNSNNLLDSSLISQYATYLPIGIYQVGSSMPIYGRFYLFPYLSTFAFLYLCDIAVYSIIEKFFHSHEWKVNLIYFFISLLIIFFYLFYDYSDYWPTIEGDWVSSAYLLVLTIPFMINLSNIKNKYSFLFIPLFIAFISETSYSFLPILTFVFLIFIIILRKQFRFNFRYFLFVLFIFFLTLYLAASTLSIDDNKVIPEVGEKLYFSIPFLTYFIILLTSLIFIVSFINKYKNFRFFDNNWIIKFWNSKVFNLHLSKKWFDAKSWWIKFIWLIISSLFLVVTVFDWVYNYKLADFPLICASVSLIILLVSNFLIIKRNKISPAYLFIFIYVILVFFIRLLMIPTDIPEYFIWRMEYTSLFVFTNYILTIKEIVILVFMIALAINSNVYHKYIFSCNLFKNIWNSKLKLSLSVAALSTVFCVPVPVCQVIYNSVAVPSLLSPSLLFHLGLSREAIEKLNKFNFENQLTFSDIYLPSVNNTSVFNLGWGFYPPYNNMNQFYWNLSFATFKDLSGKPLTINNYQEAYSKNILPYYSYVCIKNNDLFFLNILTSLNSQFQLVANINDEILIYKNISLNKINQNKFLQFNKNVGHLSYYDAINNYL